MNTFGDYLAKRRDLQNPAGAFTRLVRGDPEIEEVESWAQLRAYVHRKVHADKVKDAMEAAESLWNSYRSHLRGNRTKKEPGVFPRLSRLLALSQPK